jgi:hypothetical protein
MSLDWQPIPDDKLGGLKCTVGNTVFRWWPNQFLVVWRGETFRGVGAGDIEHFIENRKDH